jgi:hypothetical protein
MRQDQSLIGQNTEILQSTTKGKYKASEDFVLEKSIFTNIFEKDIRRVFIYKKAERLAKAIHLITPAFANSVSLKNRMDAVAVGLIDAAILPVSAARTALSQELLALSSILSVARTGGLLSAMNADLIAHEAHLLLQEVAAYEEPRLLLDEAPTLSSIAKSSVSRSTLHSAKMPVRRKESAAGDRSAGNVPKGHIKDTRPSHSTHIKDRRDSILSVIKNKKTASIKDISTFIRGVSEKTIQRELLVLIEEGIIQKKGERRWSTYSFVS